MLIYQGYVYRPARVIKREATRDRDGIPLPKSFVPKAKNFYHGTSNEAAARKILATCELRPTVIAGRHSLMSSMRGRVYLTDQIQYAMQYATEGGTNGYMFEVRRADLRDVMLDEDFVGELICHEVSPWLSKVMQQLISWYPEDFKKMLGGTRKKDFMDVFNNCSYPEVANMGKFILQHVEDDEDALNSIFEEEMERLGGNVHGGEYTAISHLGPVPISRAWKLDEEDSSMDAAKPIKLRC